MRLWDDELEALRDAIDTDRPGNSLAPISSLALTTSDDSRASVASVRAPTFSPRPISSSFSSSSHRGWTRNSAGIRRSRHSIRTFRGYLWRSSPSAPPTTCSMTLCSSLRGGRWLAIRLSCSSIPARLTAASGCRRSSPIGFQGCSTSLPAPSPSRDPRQHRRPCRTEFVVNRVQMRSVRRQEAGVDSLALRPLVL